MRTGRTAGGSQVVSEPPRVANPAAALCFVALVLASSCTVAPTGTLMDSPPIETFGAWHDAQERIAPHVPAVSSLLPGEVQWVEERDAFVCPPEARAWGCYNIATRSIHYVSLERIQRDYAGAQATQVFNDWVLEHEAGHALLHLAGDPRWGCFEHCADPKCQRADIPKEWCR